jgi:PBP1b-binding outer membrane lipoprotein LpoB
MKLIAAAAAVLLLAGCGSREDLRPAAGQSPPPQPAQAAQPQTTADLLDLPTIARPERVDEPLSRSEEREDDRFDLPPTR